MEKDVFHRLREQLDQYSMGFPATDTGVEIDILKQMFTEEEAAMFTALTGELETPAAVARRINRPIEEVAALLADMARKGLAFSRRKGESVEYSAVPFVHGLLEFRVGRTDKNTVALIGKYFKNKFRQTLADHSASFLRTVPVQQAIPVGHHVAAYDDAREILKNQAQIVVADCACRKQMVEVGRGCGKPIETCFMFGPMAQYYIDHGLGRQIDLEEALAILTKVQEAGLVTQPASAWNPFAMCNCCGDCCAVLRALNKHPRPAEVVFSNYQARIDQDKCSGCEICLDRCQMKAVSLGEDNLAVVDLDRCIGCGLCVTTCPEEAISLVPKPKELHRCPPADTREQMVCLARERGLDVGDPRRIVTYGF